MHILTKQDLHLLKYYKCYEKAKWSNVRFEDKLAGIDILQMLKRFNFRCIYCYKKIEAKRWQLDHFYSKAMGGKNKIDNICCSCRRCNLMKLDMDGHSFVKRCQIIFENNIINNKMIKPVSV